jgi:hypothetical protein
MEKFEILFELEKSLHTFEVRSNAAKIAGLLSPDFFEFGSSGSLWTREDILKKLPTEDGDSKIESINFKAKALAPEVVLITYISITTVAGIKTQFLRSSVWRKNSDRWQLEFHQGTVKK